MRLAAAVRAFALLASASFVFGLAGADHSFAKPKPPPAAPEPPPPPPMPDVALGQHFLHEAAAYASYVRQASAISPAFADPVGVAQSLRVGVAYQPAEFQSGELAYAAVAALQDRTFVAAVRAAGQTPEQRYAIETKLFADPGNVMQFEGARGAAVLAKQALVDGGERLLETGKAVRQAAYDVQRQPWSHDDVADRDSRLLTVKMLSGSPRQVMIEDVGPLESKVAAARLAADPPPVAAPDAPEMLPASGGAAAPTPAAAPPPPPPPPEPDPPPTYLSPFVIRAVALAALASIGEAGDDVAANLSWLSYDYLTEKCLGHAKNELNECLAVAKPNYEDVFCLGQPSLVYTGECVVKGAGGYVPLEVDTRPLSIPPVAGPAKRAHRRH